MTVEDTRVCEMKAYQVLLDNWDPASWTDQMYICANENRDKIYTCLKGTLALHTGYEPQWMEMGWREIEQNGDGVFWSAGQDGGQDELEEELDAHILHQFPHMTAEQLSDAEDISDQFGPFEAITHLKERDL